MLLGSSQHRALQWPGLLWDFRCGSGSSSPESLRHMSREMTKSRENIGWYWMSIHVEMHEPVQKDFGRKSGGGKEGGVMELGKQRGLRESEYYSVLVSASACLSRIDQIVRNCGTAICNDQIFSTQGPQNHKAGWNLFKCRAHSGHSGCLLGYIWKRPILPQFGHVQDVFFLMIPYETALVGQQCWNCHMTW